MTGMQKYHYDKAAALLLKLEQPVMQEGRADIRSIENLTRRALAHAMLASLDPTAGEDEG
jgi:hypothetical protein